MSDPAAGKHEFPGGHCEGIEGPRQAAVREWQEETGLKFPDGDFTGTWTSADGVYQGFVYMIANEADLDIFDRQLGSDPDGDGSETIGWWDPADLPGNPAVRAELLADIGDVLAALGLPQDGDEQVCPCGTPVVYDEANGWQHGDGSISHDDGESVSDKMRTVAKTAAPKGDAPAKGADHWPGWDVDEDTAHHWAGVLATALGAALTVDQAGRIAGAYLAAHRLDDTTQPDQAEHTASALAWLDTQPLDLATPIAATLPGMWTDGYLVGLTSAVAATSGERAERGGWQPGDTATARQVIDDAGGSDGLNDVLDAAPGDAQGMADTRRHDLARLLAKGLIAGLAAAALGRTLRDALGSMSAALTIATTEITRTSGLAALVGYQQLGITQVRWVLDPSSKTCPRCIANAGAGPIRLGASFPSGDRAAPLHPRCRCSVLPA